MRSLADRCRRIECLVLDVDGVLTDGGIVHGEVGEGEQLARLEVKHFHVRDGSALKRWHQAGKASAVITGRASRLLETRCREVGIATVLQGVESKPAAFAALLVSAGLDPEQVCFIGDDWPDLEVLRHCGLAVAVADAAPEILGVAHFVTHAVGGRGAVREAIELILHAQGLLGKDGGRRKEDGPI